MTDRTVSPRPFTFTLFDDEIEIIEGADRYNASRSAKLRKIIREWAAMRQPARTLVDGGVEYRTEGGK